MQSAAHITRPPSATADIVAAFGRPVQRFTVEQYHRMIESEILPEGERCELIHGIILEKTVPGPSHSKSTRRLLRRLVALFPEPEWVVGIQDSITLADSEPEPDFYAAIGPEDKYNHRHPEPEDLVLVVEVSDSTVGFDRRTKLPLYAAALVPEFWIIDVKARCIEVYTQPRGKKPGYRKQAIYKAGDTLPVAVGGKRLGSLTANDLLP
ncbi:MAG TPA: Uma2 family endonuclease [Urbifossiella sp.]|nr:Uma2 family endonuclease [Urbifossiella sp.]